MIRQINYNFNDLIEDCSDIIDHPNNANLLSLKRDLNKFFKDSTCTDITYTQNDAMFFGMCVLPITDKEIINDAMGIKTIILSSVNVIPSDTPNPGIILFLFFAPFLFIKYNPFLFIAYY